MQYQNISPFFKCVRFILHSQIFHQPSEFVNNYATSIVRRSSDLPPILAHPATSRSFVHAKHLLVFLPPFLCPSKCTCSLQQNFAICFASRSSYLGVLAVHLLAPVILLELSLVGLEKFVFVSLRQERGSVSSILISLPDAHPKLISTTH